MKRAIIFIVLLFFAINTFANQGIQFTEGTWKEILAKAKNENKLVFIDIYTTWCGPCRMMATETFTQKKVGDVFNTSFINFKIDAEKGEGIAIAKKFEVRAYPTYLFVNGDGDLIYRVVGFKKAEPFLNEAAIAIREQHDPKPFVQWEKEYGNGNRDKDFLLGYAKKRSLLKFASPELIEEIMPLLSEEERRDKEVMSTLIYYDPDIQFIPGGLAFNYVMENYKELEKGGIVRAPLSVLETGINNYFIKTIIPDKREDLLQVMVKSLTRVQEASGKYNTTEMIINQKKILYVYYGKTGNQAKFNSSVVDYVENGIMKLDIKGLQKADAEGYEKFLTPFLSGKVDTTASQMNALRRMARNNKMMSPSYGLRDAAEMVYEYSTNKKTLKKAVKWAETANNWFPHFSNAAVYSGMLLKTGNKKKAVEMMNVALNDKLLTESEDMYNQMKENIERVRNGELPKSLWKVETSDSGSTE